MKVADGYVEPKCASHRSASPIGVDSMMTVRRLVVLAAAATMVSCAGDAPPTASPATSSTSSSTSVAATSVASTIPPTSVASTIPPTSSTRLPAELGPSDPAHVVFDLAFVGNVRDVIGLSGRCAVTRDGAVWCWDLWVNQDRSGLIGYRALGIDDAVTVDGEIDRFCAVRRDHSVICATARVPVDTASAIFVPVEVSSVAGLPPVTGLAVTYDHSCAVTTTGEVWCWDSPVTGLPPRDDRTDRPVVAQRIDGLPPASAVGVGYTHGCALGIDHTIACWGDNTFGALGSPGPSTPTPRAATVFADASALAVGGHTTCALGRDGTVTCVGFSGFAGMPRKPFTPPQGRVAALDTDGFRVCVTLTTGRAYCRGSFGNPGVSVADAAVLLGATTVQATATDLSHVCMLTDDGRVACNKSPFVYYE